MDEGPPGAEGYEDSVTEKPSKKPVEDSCTKAEQEFLEHLNSLKIKLENGEARPMVERRGRDVSGKWIYLCFPCGAMCSGESVLQTHISGKKHKTKLALRSVWPKSIYDEHPYNLPGNTAKAGTSEKVLQKMAEEVDLHNKPPNALEVKYNKYRDVRCHIQDTVDVVKAPLLGLEYLIEHPPEQPHYEPSYICVLCSKQGHPRTIMNHMTCFWHRYNYMARHFSKASALLAPYRGQNKYREGVYVIMNRLAQRIEDKYGRLRPVNIDKEEYEKEKELIHQWLFKSKHFTEQMGCTFEEVVDADLISSLHQSNEDSKSSNILGKARDPSPPVVSAPTKPNYRRHERRNSDELSDISDDHNTRRSLPDRDHRYKDRHEPRPDARFRPYEARRRPEDDAAFRSRFALKNPTDKGKASDKDKRPPNYEYKLKLAEDKRKAAEDSAKKTLAYHEKNPEKHPLYPEEWKKFWNRRYKEIQAEGKDPSKHDFKPEWIVFWTTRMKELHDEELRVNLIEIYRKLCLTPPNSRSQSRAEPRCTVIEPRPRSRGYSRERRRSPEARRRSPEPRRRRSPEHRRRTPDRRRSPPDLRREAHRSPEYHHHSPMRHLRTRSRSPIPRARSPARTHITLDSLRRSRSPLSRRDEASRNRSPAPPHHGPSSQTVMISDDELKPDDVLSPWNSDNDLESLGSLPDARSPMPARSHTGSAVSSRASRSRQFPRDYGGGGRGTGGTDPKDLGPAENVVATLRLLVALEDYLGSLGPKIVDLMTDALKMEKDKPNSSEDLLERESAVVLIETAKEKLKGAMQAGLVSPNAHGALRAAVVRAASTLHEADTRARKKQQQQASIKPSATPAVSVAGVGAVDRAQIAQQMAAALIAQGKTDVSSEELAQLVEAVVGMAEAKKREAEVKQKQEARALADKASRPPPAPSAPPSPSVKVVSASASASALQMLQSAYDENDKRSEREDVPDAMDGLSDSDLETLLKNFNELSAEEQHSLIAYLKKLEAREPQRVERLRQYVSAAATSAPPPPPAAHPPPAPHPAQPSPPAQDNKPVTIESDDDDYTVEDVFKSVTQKVKEDQIRHEMEIVKKSLEETKPEVTPVGPAPAIDLTDMSSAAGLLALVHASIASSSSAPAPQEVVASVAANIPRSFGDAPVPAASINANQSKPLLNLPPSNSPTQGQRSIGNQDQGSFGNQGQGSIGNQGQGSFSNQGQGSIGNQGQGSFSNQGQGSIGNQGQGSFGNQGQGSFGNQGQRSIGNQGQGSFGNQGQGSIGNQGQGSFGNQVQSCIGNQGQGSFSNQGQGSFGNQGQLGAFNNQAPQDSFGDQGPQGSFNNQGQQGSFGNQNRYPPPSQKNFGGPNQGNFGPPNQGNFGGSNQGNFGTQNPNNFGSQNQSNFGGPPKNLNQSNFGGNLDSQNQGNFGESNQGNFGGNRNYPNQQVSPWENGNDNMTDNRGSLLRQPASFGLPGQDFNNQGPRGGNMNGRMQNNFGKPLMEQSFGNQGGNFQGNKGNNFQGNNNFRGRGGGRGNFRGRGRGYY